MPSLNPGRLPTIKMLDNAGHDAGALMDAVRSEIERAMASARDRETIDAFEDSLKLWHQLHKKYFGNTN